MYSTVTLPILRWIFSWHRLIQPSHTGRMLPTSDVLTLVKSSDVLVTNCLMMNTLCSTLPSIKRLELTRQTSSLKWFTAWVNTPWVISTLGESDTPLIGKFTYFEKLCYHKGQKTRESFVMILPWRRRLVLGLCVFLQIDIGEYKPRSICYHVCLFP